MVAAQLSLFEADRYHDPRVAADRARARAIAKLRPVTRCVRRPIDDELAARRELRGSQELARAARTRAA